jgi:hypothetical protein
MDNNASFESIQPIRRLVSVKTMEDNIQAHLKKRRKNLVHLSGANRQY